MLSAKDSKIQRLLEAWKKNELQCGLSKDSSTKDKYVCTAKDRTKYIALDYGYTTATSGHFLVDRKTERVYSIKGYGVPNLKKDRGTVEYLTCFINKLTTEGKAYQHPYWYLLHPVD